MAQKARYIKGLGAFGGVGDSKEEGERSRGREVAGCVAVGGLGLGWGSRLAGIEGR